LIEAWTDPTEVVEAFLDNSVFEVHDGRVTVWRDFDLGTAAKIPDPDE
jgi:limonene-1,2-epoxide hydrolase